MSWWNTPNAPKSTSKNQWIFRAIKTLVFLLTSLLHFTIQSKETIEISSQTTAQRHPSNFEKISKKIDSQPSSTVNTHPRVQELLSPELDHNKKTIVMLHSDNGFIPNQVQFESNTKVELVITNVNRNNRLASFLIDQFGIQDSMPFGEVKKIMLPVKKEGTFYIICPESGFEGKIHVLPKPRLSSQ
ncbi:MAG: cupredoxin domain-containing protein [Bdellovibrionaceae bacterium]|nr:cupredoxin domain-containing protein [Pseudobdellovibrionaceae bacterium]MDW8189396.1 cupredoxin domain-containing protein [Pseudobdellovibrionaceae bacterium]